MKNTDDIIIYKTSLGVLFLIYLVVLIFMLAN
jgi:hypothetical protein